MITVRDAILYFMQTNFAKSGNYRSGVVGSGVSQELREKLNGVLLGDAIKSGIIKVDTKEPFQKRNGVSQDGTAYSRFVLNTEQGAVSLSSGLANGGIMDYVSNLGDLRFRLTDSDSGRQSFTLGKPGGSSEVVSAATELFDTVNAD